MQSERIVSHHHNLVVDNHRTSMGEDTRNARLMVALNGVGTAYFDPRPAVVKFLEKTRRCGAPDWDIYGQSEFEIHPQNGARLVKLRRLSNVLTCKLLETCHVSQTTACVCNKKNSGI